jgi:hypothetical protein
VEYIAPSGAVQLVEDPAAMYRLQAAGWRPRPELETLAANDDQPAVEHLQRAVEFHRQQEAAQEAREARFAPKATTDGVDRERLERKPRPSRDKE